LKLKNNYFSYQFSELPKMFKKVILLFILLFLFINADSQKRIFHAGLLFGMTATQIHNDNSAGFNKIGLYAGGYVSTDFGKRIKFEIGMNYAAKGSRENSGDNNIGYNKYVARLGYIEFPFVVKYRLNKFDIEAGLSIGFLLFGNEFVNGDKQQSVTDFKKFEFAGILGASYMFNEKWGIEFRSQTSLLPIRTPTDGVFYTNGQGQYNIVMSFAVMYYIK